MAKAMTSHRGYKPTLADKRYAEPLAALSSISQEAAALCAELDEANRQRLSREWQRGWGTGYWDGDKDRRAVDSRDLHEAYALVRTLREKVHEYFDEPPPRPDLKLV